MKKTIILTVSIIYWVNVFAYANGSSEYRPMLNDFGSDYSGAALAFMTTQQTSQSTVYNPALLAFSPFFQLGYTDQGLFNNYGAFRSYPYPQGRVDITSSFDRTGVGIGFRGWYNSSWMWRASEASSVHLGGGHSVTPKVSVGATIHQFKYEITDEDLPSWYRTPYKSMALTIGAIYKPYATNKVDDGGLTIGISLRNLGNADNLNLSPYDSVSNNGQLPQRFHLGIAQLITRPKFSILLGIELEKDLVAYYPDMDWDRDGYIGRYDPDGLLSKWDYYNSKGQMEKRHYDAWYKSILTSWTDDMNRSVDSDWDRDRQIGGYTADGEYVGVGIGDYNENGELEVDVRESSSFRDELETIFVRMGIRLSFKKWVSIQIGSLSYKASGLRQASFGFSIGPEFLKYHYSRQSGYANSYETRLSQYHSLQLMISPELFTRGKKLFK